MASISTDSKGLRRILFVNPDAERKQIRLGKVPMKTAQTVKARIENLLAAQWGKHAIDGDTAAWLGDLDRVLYDRLAAVGLVPRREPKPDEARPDGATLGRFITQYIAARPGMKPNTLKNYRQEHPLHVVVAWLGNSAPMAARHYLPVTDADFDKAVQGGAKSAALEAQNQAQQAAAENCTVSQESKKTPENKGFLPVCATECCTVHPSKVPPRGVEPLFSD